MSPEGWAHRFFAALANGVPGAGKRAPISVRCDSNGTYSVIDGIATTAVGKILPLSEMPRFSLSKIADLDDNMNMLRLDEIRPKALKRLEKYHKSWKQLKEWKDKLKDKSSVEEENKDGNAK